VTASQVQTLLERLRTLEEQIPHWARTDIRQLESVTQEMMTLAAEGGPQARALALRALGTSLRFRMRLPEALDALKRSQKTWRAAGEATEWARTVIATIPVLVQMDRYREAIRASTAALNCLLEKGETLAAARLLNNMGAMYGNMGRPRDALRCFTEGEQLTRRAQKPDLQARFNQNRAVVLEQLGSHAEALSATARALRYWLRAGEHVAAARSQQTGAIALFNLGQFGKALKRFSRARDGFAASSAPRDVAVCDLYIAACYLELNRHDQTLVRVRMALENLDSAQAGFQYAWARLHEGVALSGMGRAGEALQSLAEAHRWFDGHRYEAAAAKAKLEEADALLKMDRTGEAIKAARLSAALFRRAHMPVDEARAQLLRAEGYLQRRRRQEAAAAAALAYPVFHRAHMPGPLFRTLHLLGRIAMLKGDWDGARRYLNQAIETAERVRVTVQLEYRREFLADKSSAYADLVWLHLQQGRLASAHKLADLAKSRALADSLTPVRGRRRNLTSPADLALLVRLDAARRKYQAVSTPQQLAPEVALALRGGSLSVTAQRVQAEAELAALWDEWELRQAAGLRPEREAEPAGTPWFRLLPANGAMVEYFLTGRSAVAFVSDRRGLRGWVDLGEVEPVRRSLELLQLNLDTSLVMVSSGRAIPPGLFRNANALLQDLHDRLWKPLRHLLGRRQRVVVIPHGILHFVPFEALYDGGQHLMQSVEISLAPSRGVWVRCTERAQRLTGGPDQVLGCDAGGALPFVNDEVRWVSAALGTEPLLGADATSASLADGGERRILHMAMHGEFRQDHPHFSTLLLADGPLTAADVAGLHLGAQLVVLSGCETGLSRVTRGEELMGMITAFLQAGSASVMASRWRVDDQVTAELMEAFYHHLLAGQTKAEALRLAQAGMAASGTHPLFWAGFGLIGHGGLLVEPNLEGVGTSAAPYDS
jgi:tetratricopeptide (TPR) repeat protein